MYTLTVLDSSTPSKDAGLAWGAADAKRSSTALAATKALAKLDNGRETGRAGAGVECCGVGGGGRVSKREQGQGDQ